MRLPAGTVSVKILHTGQLALNGNFWTGETLTDQKENKIALKLQLAKIMKIKTKSKV